jgi:mono/diheme cytochrome c family protein
MIQKSTKDKIAVGLLLAGALSMSSCRYDSNVSGLHWFLDMHDNYAVEAQEEDPSTRNVSIADGLQKGGSSVEAFGGPGSTMRVPPEGTVARNQNPYPFEAWEVEEAGKALTNPLTATKEVMERGKKMYEINCAVCHGYKGNGDGPVVNPFPAPPSFVSASASTKTWNDGKIFHLITMGRGLMKPYAAQVKESDRWAIIHYVRLLQKSGLQ